MELLIATKNLGKIKEIERFLTNLPITLRSLNDFPKIIEPEETSMDFTENAILKAKFYASETGILALADDSGLEVEALKGAPGVFSARYAGVNASDEEKINKLLNELKDFENDNRRARFVCAMALVDENGEIHFFTEGVCEGNIANSPRGENGFGYDPIFVPEGFSETFGELSNDIKAKISHRARAVIKIIEFLRDFIAA